MGTQFFWAYDALIIAVVIAVAFHCWKKGAAATIVRFLAFVAALAAAVILSDAVANVVYSNAIREPLADYIDGRINISAGDNAVAQLNKIDMSKAYVNGKKISDLKVEIDTSGRATLDISGMDLSETGIAEVDLSMFGIDSATADFSAISVGLVQFTQTELDEYGTERLILAKMLTMNAREGQIYTVLCEISEKISEVMPLTLGNYADEVSAGKSDALYKLILGMVSVGTGNASDAVMSAVIDPIIKVPLRALIFVAIFAIIMIVVEIISNLLRVINKIPVLGTVNAFFGGILGVAEGLLICVLISICLQVLIALTNNSLIFINTLTIDKTFLFKYIYNFELINFFA